MGLSFRKRNHKNRSPAPVVGDGVESVSLATVPASSVDPTSPTATTRDEWGTPVKGGHDDFGSGRIDSDDDDRPDAEEEDETPLRSNHAPTAFEKDVGVYPPRMETSAQSDDAFDNPGWLSPEGVAAGMKRGKAGSKRGGGKARDRGAGGALRKMKGIGFLTPPKKDTERVFVDGRRGAESSPPSVMDGEGLFGGERQQEELGVEPPSPPPPVMGPFDPNISNIFGNENGWGGGGGFDSGFEIMLETNIVGEGVDGGDGGGDASGGGGDGRGSSDGPPDEGHRHAGGGGRSKNSSCEHSLAVGTTAQTTVKATNARGSSSPPRRRNLTSLFESVTEDDNDENSVDGTDDGDSDGDGDGDDGAIAPGDVVNDAGAGGGDHGGLRGGVVDGAAAAASGDRRVAPAAEGAAADKKSRSALYRLSLTRRGGGASSARGGPSKRRPAGAAAPPPTAATTSTPDLPAPRKPREPTPPPAPGAPREHEDGVSPPKVPQFITRCDDDVSKTSTLTEPDVARRALAVRARSSQPSLIVGTIAEGFPASGASRSMASGASVAETVDKLWSACPYNLDTAYALLDNVLQFLPCSGEIKDAVDLELEVDEKFALDFQTEIIKTGVRLIYHQSPINANTDWVQSTVKLILRPGNCHGSQLRQPTLVWAVLPVVSRMKASGTFDASLFEAEKMWSTLSLLDVHSIMGDEASSFFSITAANGVVHLFEAPSGEARDYVVKGLRLVVSRLTYHMIVGDSKIIDELFSEDGAESTGDLPSLTKPSNALSKIVHSLLDQQ